ncbi:uncharacterized protein K489DRAFT_231666 [Dissoconium aciculare CBS 342.82]|uniref:Uncharacterized protein n=1 Tax=Dissoconium aciculare CBS 342.82 TaxID=1314786 RepID=A0A6J3M218_9PEZI|nr:uncharacterized protein K489DRAFT_231666 [Dissoconium aciculare CBS 342.82]KAF1822065.1 hypothetical protein K489DRAFT_231666 [Dissoconium aciculare CBS 342.82]
MLNITRVQGGRCRWCTVGAKIIITTALRLLWKNRPEAWREREAKEGEGWTRSAPPDGLGRDVCVCGLSLLQMYGLLLRITTTTTTTLQCCTAVPLIPPLPRYSFRGSSNDRSLGIDWVRSSARIASPGAMSVMAPFVVPRICVRGRLWQ